MSLWQAILSKIREILSRLKNGRTVEGELNVSPAISTQMENAINTWGRLYENDAPWLQEPNADNGWVRVVSLGLPSLIASEKARTALIEFKSEITTPTQEVEKENPDYGQPTNTITTPNGQVVPVSTDNRPTIIEDVPVSDTGRAEYLNEQYKKLLKRLRVQVEYGIAKGGLVIKPYAVKNAVINEGDNAYSIEFDFIQADAFYPLSFDASGKITEAAFLESLTSKEYTYYRLEYHKWENNTVTVVNRAYKSTDVQGNNNKITSLGKEVPLSEVPQWASLQPETKVGPVDRPLFAYFKMPEANTVDVTSPLGVSGFNRAIPLIKDADKQYSRLLWEYEAGEMAVDIDRDALRPGNDGGPSRMPEQQQRLFRKVDLGASGDTYQPYAPALRDSSYIQGLNAILMRIEDAVALSRGTLSDVSSEARTATELKILKQRSYQSNNDIQQALEDCLKDTIYIMNVYCDLYEITPAGEYDANFEWDDSILVDVDTELNKRLTLMQNGLSSKVEVRMWYFGETQRQAEQALADIDAENAKNMEENLEMQMAQGFSGQESMQ